LPFGFLKLWVMEMQKKLKPKKELNTEYGIQVCSSEFW